MGRDRYTYTEFTSYDFAKCLSRIGMKDATFARLWRVRAIGKVAKWRTGQEDIPPWVAVACAMMEEHPGNVVTLREIAANTIVRDNMRPQDGDYPFLWDNKEGDQE